MGKVFLGRVSLGRSPKSNELLADAGSPTPITLSLDGDEADIRVGGSGESGDIRIYAASDSLEPTIHIDGGAGDIRLFGADCAEVFDAAEGHEGTQPGSTMCLDEFGKVYPSLKPYDKSVVGIVSGAGDYRPGIVLGATPSNAQTLRIALLGRVNCRVDARSVSIEVGDMLTTSQMPGHAMKASDQSRSSGAVVGKALRGLEGQLGMIPVLVGTW